MLFSSYVDDIACTKILMWGAPVVASSATGTSCSLICSFLSWCLILITSDWDFLVVWDLLLRCNRVLLYIIVVLLVIFGC